MISAFSVIGIWRAVISDSSVIYLTFKIIYIMASVSALRAAQVIAGNSYHTDIRLANGNKITHHGLAPLFGVNIVLIIVVC